MDKTKYLLERSRGYPHPFTYENLSFVGTRAEALRFVREARRLSAGFDVVLSIRDGRGWKVVPV